MIRNINIPEEDRAVLPFEYDESSKHADSLDVAVVMPAHISNFTDFARWRRNRTCGCGR